MDKKSRHVSRLQVSNVANSETRCIRNFSRVDDLTWGSNFQGGIGYETSFPESCVEGFKGEVGVTGVVEAGDDMASLHPIID